MGLGDSFRHNKDEAAGLAKEKHGKATTILAGL
jgi:uncharacterized protein YjbJ (UPF0337 family)